MNSRIESIKRYANAEQIKKAEEERAKEMKLENDVNEILTLWERADELIKTYNACVDYGIEVPKYGRLTDVFTSDSQYHRLGFGVFQPRNEEFGIAKQKHRNTISIRGGGCCHYEIDFYDGKLYFYGEDAPRRIETFVREFNEFEERFYNWIDELTK